LRSESTVLANPVPLRYGRTPLRIKSSLAPGCRASHSGGGVAAEARLKPPHDGLTYPCHESLRPGDGTNPVDDITALWVHTHLEQLLAALRMIRERSVRESEPLPAAGPVNAVETRAPFNDQNPRCRISTATTVPVSIEACPGKASTQPMSKCLHVASATRALSKSPSPRPMVTTCSSKRPTPDGCLTIPAGLYDNGKR
jgi:hypothetical protein